MRDCRFWNTVGKYWAGILMILLSPSLLADSDFNWHAKGLDDYVVESNKDEWLEIESSPCGKQIAYSIADVTGRKVNSGSAANEGCVARIRLNLDKGYYSISINGVSRGLFSVPQKHLPDYFGVDAALTYIIKDAGRRAQYISLLNKVGIGVVRERLMWGDLSPLNEKWDGVYRVDELRKEYRDSGIKVLDVVQAPPGEKNGFPAPAKVMADFSEFSKRWGLGWLGIEPKNEPNNVKGGPLSKGDMARYVDSYVSYSKEMHAAVGNNVLVVNGSFAGGLSANANFSSEISSRKEFFKMKGDFSFHTYENAESLVRMLAQYNSWLGSNKFIGGMWITESGWIAYADDLRTVNPQNTEVAVQIAAKSIVGYCSGVKHYFAFVLPFYRERDRHGKARYFGLTDKEGSPNLSLAAYVQAGQVLASSNQSDVKISTYEHGFRALIPSDDHVVVAVYNNSEDAILIPASASYAEGIDGRKIKLGRSRALSGEKLVYFYFSGNDRSAADRFFMAH